MDLFRVSREKDKLTIKRVKIQFRGNYDVIVKDSFVYAIMIVVFTSGLWKLYDLLKGLLG